MGGTARYTSIYIYRFDKTYDHEINIILLGDKDVGKTSITNDYPCCLKLIAYLKLKISAYAFLHYG